MSSYPTVPASFSPEVEEEEENVPGATTQHVSVAGTCNNSQFKL